MIVTAWAEESDMDMFHRMRQRFFPGHRNYLSAHITLFHHLKPDVRTPAIEMARQTDWSQHVELDEQGRFKVGVQNVFSMGKGVAYGLDPAPLIALREPFREAFAERLTSQDARPWKRPHITVQNKVDKSTADRLKRHLAARFSPCFIRIKGLRFWRYDYGPWTLLEEVTLTNG